MVKEMDYYDCQVAQCSHRHNLYLKEQELELIKKKSQEQERNITFLNKFLEEETPAENDKDKYELIKQNINLQKEKKGFEKINQEHELKHKSTLAYLLKLKNDLETTNTALKTYTCDTSHRNYIQNLISQIQEKEEQIKQLDLITAKLKTNISKLEHGYNIYIQKRDEALKLKIPQQKKLQAITLAKMEGFILLLCVLFYIFRLQGWV